MRRVLAGALAAGSVLLVGCAPSGLPNPVLVQPPSDGGYDRAYFGASWLDLDHDGCDTRAEVLMRDLSDETVQARPCRVVSGVLTDPYTGISEGRVNATFLDVDHVVSLADAWRSGADGWTQLQRERFANDEEELLATRRGVNRSKGDRGPGEWLPSSQAGRCLFVARWSRVKAAYQLRVTAVDAAAVARVQAECGQGTPQPSVS